MTEKSRSQHVPTRLPTSLRPWNPDRRGLASPNNPAAHPSWHMAGWDSADSQVHWVNSSEKKNAEMMLFARNSLHQIDVKRRIPGADCPPEAMKNICIYGQKSSFHATRPPTKKTQHLETSQELSGRQECAQILVR